MNHHLKMVLVLAMLCCQHISTESELSSTDYFERGVESHKNEQFDDAIANFQQAIALDNQNPNIPFMLASTLLATGKIYEAINFYKQVISMAPKQSIPVAYNIAYTLKIAERFDQAIPIFEEIVQKAPSYDAARLGLSFAYLSKGDYKKGWQAHEWNLQKQGKFAPEMRAIVSQNQVTGKNLLLLPEGGIGDTFNFIRYAKRLHDLGACVNVVVQKPLVSLISRCPYINQVMTSGTPIENRYHAHATLMSMPAIFYDDEETIPRDIPYLFADPYLVSLWRKRLEDDHALKIGICWQCDVHNDVSRLPIARRGIPLATLAQLFDIPGTSWYSLQKKEGLEQLEQFSELSNLHTFPDKEFDELHGPFMDTAALIMNMDVILTIDSAIAHLAGALGKKVIILLPYSSDWRWIAGRSDSPWYPSATIIKQRTPFDWNFVLQRVRSEISMTLLTKQH